MLEAAATIAVVAVALLHAWFLVLEMFLWDKRLGLRTFGMTPEKAAAASSPGRTCRSSSSSA